MMQAANLPEPFKGLVAGLHGLVTTEDIDVFAKRQDVLDRSHRLRTIVNTWKDQQDQDRALRKTYAKVLLWILALEVVMATTAFFLIGANVISVDTWVANVFFF